MSPLAPDHHALPPPPFVLLRGASLFLDLDGTLVDIAATPGAVVVDAALRALLDALLIRMDGRLAIVSGRSIGDLERLLGRLPCYVAGSHGLELRWPDGRRTATEQPDTLATMITQTVALRAAHPGVLIEEKPFGVALHYRADPRAEAACRALAVDLARASGWSLQTGKMVYELRPEGTDKGTALRRIMAELGDTVPIAIGDDDTDEAAFVASTELGGAGIRVQPDRPTAAHYSLDSVAATRAWLEIASQGLS